MITRMTLVVDDSFSMLPHKIAMKRFIIELLKEAKSSPNMELGWLSFSNSILVREEPKSSSSIIVPSIRHKFLACRGMSCLHDAIGYSYDKWIDGFWDRNHEWIIVSDGLNSDNAIYSEDEALRRKERASTGFHKDLISLIEVGVNDLERGIFWKK